MSSTQPPVPPIIDPLKAGPFGKAKAAQPNVEDATATGAWHTLTRALGRDLQTGMHRAEQARRRLARMR
jgi:hypothetical protein